MLFFTAKNEKLTFVVTNMMFLFANIGSAIARELKFLQFNLIHQKSKPSKFQPSSYTGSQFLGARHLFFWKKVKWRLSILIFRFPKCPGPATQVPIDVEGWNFYSLRIYASRVNCKNFSLLAQSEGAFWPQSLSVKINSTPLYMVGFARFCDFKWA